MHVVLAVRMNHMVDSDSFKVTLFHDFRENMAERRRRDGRSRLPGTGVSRPLEISKPSVTSDSDQLESRRGVAACCFIPGNDLEVCSHSSEFYNNAGALSKDHCDPDSQRKREIALPGEVRGQIKYEDIGIWVQVEKFLHKKCLICFPTLQDSSQLQRSLLSIIRLHLPDKTVPG